MRRLLFTAAALLLGCNASLAQVSTMGTTAMGLPSTPGTIVTSPLNGPSPFSATTQPGAPDTTLAPVPLASDPTTPGTVVTCATPTGQIAPGTPAVPVTSLSAMAGTDRNDAIDFRGTDDISNPGQLFHVDDRKHDCATDAVRTTSYIIPDRFSRLDRPVPPPPAVPPPPSPSIAAMPVPTSSTAPSTVSTSMPGTTATTTSSTATMHRPR